MNSFYTTCLRCRPTKIYWRCNKELCCSNRRMISDRWKIAVVWNQVVLFCHFALDNVFYKTALITYKTLKTGQLVYPCDLLHYHQPARTLRSSSQLLLYQPVTRINLQSKAFRIMARAVWNSVSPLTKSSIIITTSKEHVKTELFSAAFDTV